MYLIIVHNQSLNQECQFTSLSTEALSDSSPGTMCKRCKQPKDMAVRLTVSTGGRHKPIADM